MEELPGMLETAQKVVHRICAAIMQQSSLRENSGVTLQTALMQNRLL